MSENLKDILDSIKESINKNDDSIDSFLIDTEHWVELLDYITNLQERIFKARKMIFDNYGVLDKYEIELLDDILKGDE